MPLIKKLKITSIIIISIILLFSAGALITYYLLKPSYNYTEKGNITDTTIINRDDRGVPLITANSKEDVLYALGYSHAKDRLNMMEYQRAIATGASSYFIKNQDGQLLDELASIIGFTRIAESLLTNLSEENINMIKSYTKGVNHIKHTRHLMPARTEDWNPVDILAILIMKEWSEALLSDTRLFFNFNETKKIMISRIFPDVKYFNYYDDNEYQYIYTLNRVRNLVEKYIGLFNNGFAAYIDSSMNNSDERNYTLFSYNSCYDIYPGWYPVSIKLGNETINTITYSGLPFFFTFKNNSVSMVHYSINVNSQNFYLFNTRKINNITQYNYGGTWKDLASVRVPIYKNKETLHSLKWITEKGPILSDLIVSQKHDDRILCINSAFPGPKYISILINSPFETDTKKLKNQLTETDSALKSYILSTETGTYKIFSGFVSALRTTNSVLEKNAQMQKTDLVKISSTKLISGLDFIGSDITTSKDITSIQPENILTNNLRLKKINDLLPYMKIYNEDMLKEIIMDTHSGAADIYIPLFKQILETNPLTSGKLVKIYFNEWDLTTLAKLQAPTIFYLTLNNLFNETLRDELGNDTDTILKNSYLLFNDYFNLFQKNASQVFDNIKTDDIETREMIFDKAFLGAMRTLNRKTGPLMETWKWGEFNRNAYKISNLTSGLYSKFFKLDATSSNGAPDSIYYTSFNSDFKPVNTTSLTGYTTQNSFKFRANFSYSTSILSDFYYGSNKNISLTDLNTEKSVYTTIIKNGKP